MHHISDRIADVARCVRELKQWLQEGPPAVVGRFHGPQWEGAGGERRDSLVGVATVELGAAAAAAVVPPERQNPALRHPCLQLMTMTPPGQLQAWYFKAGPSSWL